MTWRAWREKIGVGKCEEGVKGQSGEGGEEVVLQEASGRPRRGMRGEVW